MTFRIGTSGYSYEDWKESFYPSDLKPSRFLNYYAKYFDTVEIDSTYYRIPHPRVFEAIGRKVPHEFRFSVKTPSTFTHQREEYSKTLDAFHKAVKPLFDKGLLGCFLAQFPASFKHDPQNLEHLSEMRSGLEDLAPVCVEFRHISWQIDEVYRFLEDRELGAVNVDLPKLPRLPRPSSAVTSEIAYFRFHGRNAKQWWRPSQPHERYDYDYSSKELEEWVPKIREAEGKAKDTYILFNNHFRGQSARAAILMKRLLGIKAGEPVVLREKQQQLFP